MDNNLILYGKKVLFIGAHPDDIELGCGALIANILPRTDVYCVTLSDNQKNPQLNNVVSEHFASMEILGMEHSHVIVGQFETRRFPEQRQAILEYLLKLRKDLNPDMVFAHTTADVHQDHGTVTQEALRAFRGISLFGYDVIRSSHGFFPTFLVEVTPADVEKKIRALGAYKTYQDKYYFSPELTRSILVRNGAICERPYAEGFDMMRLVGAFSAAKS
jgi:LmbE family N-acetylglucosaminyl deacetylase